MQVGVSIIQYQPLKYSKEKTVEIPKTMRASVLREVGVIEIEERPVPKPQANEVLVKVAQVGVCGSDVHYYQHGRIGDFVVGQPLILGHEASGVIVAVGSEVNPERIGERVSIEPQRSCRKCEFCRSGHYNLCPDMEFYATPPIDGAFCEYVTIEEDFAFALPDNISDAAGAMMEPLSVGISACQKGGIKVNDTVLIAGAGPIGIMTLQCALAFGAGRVVVSDISENRRQMALSYGATEAVDPRTHNLDGLGAEVFIDCSGAEAAITAGIRATRSGGTVVFVGSADVIPLSVPEVAMRELNVTGIFRYTQTWPIARHLLASGKVDVDSLVTHAFGLDEVELALQPESTPNSLKRVVIPSVRTVENHER